MESRVAAQLSSFPVADGLGTQSWKGLAHPPTQRGNRAPGKERRPSRGHENVR